jgi:NADPH2:quinone reductase
VPAHQALRAMTGWSPAENAAFAVNYVTAWVALIEMARLRPADRVLVTAAAGGVGTAAVQIARHFGCTVYGAAGSDDKLELLRRLGVAHVVNYRARSLEREVREATAGAGVDVVLEVVGGDVYRQSQRVLAPFGRLVVTGFASLDLKRWNPFSWWRTWRDAPRARIGSMATHSTGVLATHIGYLLPDRERMLAVWRELTGFVSRTGIRPIVGGRLSFDRMGEAHALLEARATTGKLVVDAP